MILSPRKVSTSSCSSSSTLSLVVDSEKKTSSAEEDDQEKTRAGGETETLPTIHIPVKAGCDASSSSPSKSSNYFVIHGDPIATAAKLGASEAKLIGSKIIGNLRFESHDREHDFLSQAGASFYFPLMEKELMKIGVPNMLQCAQDLEPKSFVATRRAARQLQAEASYSSRVSELEERIAA
ncbi:hypothetical protein C2845_PM08G12790 [Panicum miliaceum]|uniref:Uncharacterized protein n=1 Tax=Panicum miliaceum TaxID=4540 RepID=A0A3L6QZS8_PANMI|nr:hypothetical protein C2845_PM08G12790 [Panicum miliaceum]